MGCFQFEAITEKDVPINIREKSFNKYKLLFLYDKYLEMEWSCLTVDE